MNLNTKKTGLFIICTECKGTGKIDISHFIPKKAHAICGTCKGTGRLEVYAEGGK